MNSKSLIKLFILSLVVMPVVYAIARQVVGETGEKTVITSMIAATVLVEVFALSRILRVRKGFSPSDPGYLTWTLILAFMIIRLVAEARLLTMTYNIVPEYQAGGSAALYFYVVVLRYLYTISDVLFVGALITTIRSYRSTGLPFKLLSVDYLYILALCTLPVITYLFRENLIQTAFASADGYKAFYRLLAVSVGAVIASLCIIVRRYALQMGGGAVARVWNTVVVAGVARDGSFLALALISNWSTPAATFVEQYLLWIFACCWVLAARYQSEVFSRTTTTHRAYVAESPAEPA
jgi:hypothetical protein